MSDDRKKLRFRAREYSADHSPTEGGGVWMEIPLRHPTPSIERALAAVREEEESRGLDGASPELVLQKTYEVGYAEGVADDDLRKHLQERLESHIAENKKLEERLAEKSAALEQALAHSTTSQPSEVSRHLSLLGRTATDKVTKFRGTVTTISFDLYGCVQAIVTPPVGEKLELRDGRWFDVCRLHVYGERCMEPPNFEEGPEARGEKGGYDKPLPRG